MDQRRIRRLNNIPAEPGNVCYWMSRDQRVEYNFALKYAQEYALEFKSKLFIVFNVTTSFLSAALRQYDFMLRGLYKLNESLKYYNIPFYIMIGEPKENIPAFLNTHNIKLLVTDFDPLKIKRRWKKEVNEKINIPMIEVDTHNIVPAFYVSDKKEYGAYTIRRKILKVLDEFLYENCEIEKHPFNNLKFNRFDPSKIINELLVSKTPAPTKNFLPGAEEGRLKLKDFIENKLNFYHLYRSNPNFDVQSDLSPYLHFGMISAKEVALSVKSSENPQEAKNAFLEELIIRKELADNFCLYEDNYDNINGAPDWAIESLIKHNTDKRDHIYKLEDFENAKTHDRLWNACQIQMVEEGKMHNYLRMYWAKKILQWTESVEDALNIAIYLNDKYELDGRDPNGYTGIMWSICGVHDRPWKERNIFGKIRYMSYEGCRKKFNVDVIVKRYNG